MEDNEQVVTGDESATSTQPLEQQASAEPEKETQSPSQGQDTPAVDEFGVPWKNRAMEFQRKLQETTEYLPKLVEDAVSKVSTPKVQEEYTIAQLEQFAISRPEMRPWVEEEKAKVIRRDIEKSTESRLQNLEKQRQAQVARVQSEQWLVNNPAFQECFITDSQGRKNWNHSNPLTQMIANYMNDPRIKNEPEGIVFAAKSAYADYMLSNLNKTQEKLKTVQSNLKTVQRQTMIEGGSNQNVESVDDITKAKQKLAQTGSRRDAEELIGAILTRKGILK